MNETKKSPIQISELSLIGLVFKKKTNTYHLDSDILPTDSLRITATVEAIENFSYLTICRIGVYEENIDASFEISLHYQIISKITDEQFKADLEKFAKFGAPFNALVHARETIVSLISKAFGKIALLPLLDITEFGKSLNIIEKPRNERPILEQTEVVSTDSNQ